ncbi:MAG: molybdopterin-guanine dinucleotide biosynthesis protein MobB, partial [Candidatus Methanomethylicia archaeon]|nr:molybdopterin-guanine dinucleotide biosynthesis protein MobB [Candidatus Methanomethylicia archaeon]
MSRIPFAIAIVAPGSGYGKTTLIEGIVSYLAARGMRVFVVKHTPEEPAIQDNKGKDTWRFREAGAFASAIISSS